MADFRETFEAYGADYEATMERLMGRESFYLRLLDILFQDTNLEKLGEKLEDGDLAGAFEAAHALKGAVGNMGLVPLYDSICTILEPLRAGDDHADYPVLYQEIRMEFQKADILRSTLKGDAQ